MGETSETELILKRNRFNTFLPQQQQQQQQQRWLCFFSCNEQRPPAGPGRDSDPQLRASAHLRPTSVSSCRRLYTCPIPASVQSIRLSSFKGPPLARAHPKMTSD
ncbi:hypothetical protein R3I94_017496 [Phoxinus phoxinus]